MKRKVAALLSVALMVTMLSPLAAVAAIYHSYVKTNNYGPLNMRSDVSVNSEKTGSIPYGKQVIVWDYYNGNTWALVEYNGKQGYVMTRYLTNDKPEPKPAPNPTPAPAPYPYADLTRMVDGFQDTSYWVMVRPATPGGFVHMRWAPSKQMGIMKDFFDGMQLEVLSQNRTWCQVRDQNTGKTGFMMRSFLQEIGYGGEVGYGAEMNTNPDTDQAAYQGDDFDADTSGDVES